MDFLKWLVVYSYFSYFFFKKSLTLPLGIHKYLNMIFWIAPGVRLLGEKQTDSELTIFRDVV